MAKNRKLRRYFPSQQANRPARFLRRPRVEIDRGLAWYAIWTVPRAEEQVRDDLDHAGFATYLPMQALEIVKRGRLVEIERVPVSRYLFVGTSAADPDLGGIQAVLAGWFILPNGVLIWPDGEREPIRVGAGALQAHADECTGNGLYNGLRGVANGRSPLRRYQEARIVSGPLCGLRMRVSDVLCEERVKGLVDMLGGKVVVEATMDQLEAA